jgi:CobQ-like glutamine amidotransferase family enzyme
MSDPKTDKPAADPKPADQGTTKPDHHHAAGPLPTDYQPDSGTRYRRIAVRSAGGGATRGTDTGADSTPEAAREATPGAAPDSTPAAAPGPTPNSTPAGEKPKHKRATTDASAAPPPPDPRPTRPDPNPPILDPTDGFLSSATPVPVPLAPAHHAVGAEHCRDHAPLRIAHLYPSLLNVAGDGGNLMALQRRAEWRGIPVEVEAVEKGETPDFRDFDIVLFHGGQDVEMAVVAADFSRKAPSLREAVGEGVVVFAVCAGLQLLGHRYVSSAGEEMVGAGILDLETRGGPQRFMQHAACEVEINGVKEVVVGFENHSGLTELGSGCQPFGTVLAGAGNNGRDGFEGARSGNVFATYLHGPVLPKNPWLTDQVLKIALGRMEGIAAGRVALSSLDDTLERGAHEVALNKAMANRGKRTALEPARLVRGRKAG